MQKVWEIKNTAVSLHCVRDTNKNHFLTKFTIMAFYISKTNKNASDPCRANTSDTFVTKGYDTENEAFAVLSKVDRKTYGDYRIVEYTHINNKLTIRTCR